MSEQTVEQEIQAKVLTEPRVTQEDINRNIESYFYFTAAQAAGLIDRHVDKDSPLHLLTFCVIVLRNGFTVTGESACVSPENFDFTLGCRIAREDAVKKIWPLMGYALKEQLHCAARGDENQYTSEQEAARRDLILGLLTVLECKPDELRAAVRALI